MRKKTLYGLVLIIGFIMLTCPVISKDEKTNKTELHFTLFDKISSITQRNTTTSAEKDSDSAVGDSTEGKSLVSANPDGSAVGTESTPKNIIADGTANGTSHKPGNSNCTTSPDSDKTDEMDKIDKTDKSEDDVATVEAPEIGDAAYEENPDADTETVTEANAEENAEDNAETNTETGEKVVNSDSPKVTEEPTQTHKPIIAEVPPLNTTAASTSNSAAADSLVWSDEFNGSSLNTANWSYEIGNGNKGWGNNELQYYTDSTKNVRVEDGSLIIEALKDGAGGMQYTSGRIKTQGVQQFTYGKIEARIKLPNGQGLWPAFWLLGANISQTPWPACGAIDVLEHINSESVIYGSCHWDKFGYASNRGKTSVDVTNYHVYSVEWNSSSIRWCIDGTPYYQTDITDSSMDEFHKPFFIVLNLAVGGNFPGSPNGSGFPAKMYVDYVRVYK